MVSISLASSFSTLRDVNRSVSIAALNSHRSRVSCGTITTHRPQPIQMRRQLGSLGLGYNPLRDFVTKGKGKGCGAVCYSPLNPRNLQWVSTVANAVLVLAKGTAIHKSFLVPLFVLQAPQSIVSWMKGEYGTWSAFLALLIRLFFFIPGEFELPLNALLLVIVCPHQVTNLRGTKEGVIVSLVTAAYLAYQHFSRVGSLGQAFERGSIIASLATICVLVVPCLLLV